MCETNVRAVPGLSARAVLKTKVEESEDKVKGEGLGRDISVVINRQTYVFSMRYILQFKAMCSLADAHLPTR